MSFRDFTLQKVQHDFGLTQDASKQLFIGVAPVPLTGAIRDDLNAFLTLGMNSPTEKGRSELLVAPMLAEVWRHSNHKISLYSGLELNVDESAGLNGVCDFLLNQSPQLY